MPAFEELHTILEKFTGLAAGLQVKILWSILIVIAIWFVRYVALKIMWRRIEDVRIRYVWQKSLLYLAVVLGMILIGRVWFTGFQSIFTFLGLLTAGVAIALRDIVTNIAGWTFIMLRRPFTMGDRIRVMDHTGDVIDIRLFLFTVMEIGEWVAAVQSTGRIIHIPNSTVFTRSLINYSKGFMYIWDEIPVLVTFESNWRKAKSILMEIAEKYGLTDTEIAEQHNREASRKYMIFYTTLTPTVYTSVEDNGVLLTMRYLVRPKKRRGVAQSIWENILDSFGAETDIDFAYPTVRVYGNPREGKEGTKPR